MQNILSTILNFLSAIFGGGEGANPLSFLTTILEQVFGNASA